MSSFDHKYLFDNAADSACYFTVISFQILFQNNAALFYASMAISILLSFANIYDNCFTTTLIYLDFEVGDSLAVIPASEMTSTVSTRALCG